jgi:hypothetical protein
LKGIKSMADKLSIWTIYNHLENFPDDYVARRFELDKPTEEFYANPELELVRQWIVAEAKKYNQGIPYKVTAGPRDDTVILECWL